TGVNVSVSMGKLRTIQVFVLGEVESPGIYTVSSIATVSNALLYSGGPTKLGSLRKIQIKRGGKLFSTIDLYDFMLKGDTTQDIRLMPQDVIFVPQTKTVVSVSGDVKRPAVYEFTDAATLIAAVELAGGLTPKAMNQRVQIQRYHENSSKVILDIPYEKLNKNNDFPLKDGDLVKVFSVFDESRNLVFLCGNVRYPGQYAHKTGIHILDLLPDVEALDVDTYFDYALIKRYPLKTMKSELIPFDLGKLIIKKDESQNILLEPRDEIYIFNKSMFEERISAEIEGPVRKPGRYFIDSDGMRLKDLVLKAGNLTRDAHMGVVHLYRVKKDTTEINLITLNLDKAINGDPANNLILEDQDRVIVHNKWDFKEKYNVSIKGMVNNPGEYPYAENMTTADLIRIAGNIKTAAYMEEAELVRINIIENRQVETSVEPFNITLALNNDPLHNRKLQPLDVITVKSIPDWWGLKDEVEITGEVYFPGKYNIRKGEKISELIERAGGFTEYSYLRGAVFTRESVQKVQQQRIDDMLNRLEEDYTRFSSQEAQSALSKDDLALQGQFLAAQKALINKLRTAKASGRVVLKIVPANLFKTTPSDLKLDGGDTIYIPKEPATVNVVGAVYNPNAFTYNKDKTLEPISKRSQAAC
ncbi:MAG: SLBB domain-containing protein, partial [Proteobacteria bacterium]|nr:SLBB domain-containing protein [Pseudomonadota bacterium]